MADVFKHGICMMAIEGLLCMLISYRIVFVMGAMQIDHPMLWDFKIVLWILSFVKDTMYVAV